MWQCSNCGEEIDDNFEVCWNCQFGKDGTQQPILKSVANDQPIRIPEQKQKLTTTTKIFLVGIIAIIAVILAVKISREVLERQHIAESLSSGSSYRSEANSGKLTNEKAQGALKRWIESINSSGSIRVIGIQEDNRQNSARADIQFSNFQYLVNQPLGAGQTKMEWSGGGTAYFMRYNDGRWILSSVYTSQGAASRWWEGIAIRVDD